MTEVLIREPVVTAEADDAPPPREGRVRFLLRRPGLVLSLLIRPRRTWVRVSRTVIEVAALDRVPRSGRDLDEHVRRLQEEI